MTEDEKLMELKAKGYNPNYIPEKKWIDFILGALVIIVAVGIS